MTISGRYKCINKPTMGYPQSSTDALVIGKMYRIDEDDDLLLPGEVFVRGAANDDGTYDSDLGQPICYIDKVDIDKYFESQRVVNLNVLLG